MTKNAKLYPRLVVGDAAAALAFYTAALGAAELVRFAGPDDVIVHAEVQVGDGVFYLTQADGGLNRSPVDVGGSPLLLTLVVSDADAVGAAFEAAGGEVIIPIDDQFYGRREGRLQDPFGHLWIISQDAENLPDDEIRRSLGGE